MPTPYALDPTGISLANKITNELHALPGGTPPTYKFIVPVYAPFFAEGLIVSYTSLANETSTLVEGQDYYLTHWFIGASRACAKPIYGSITILNQNLAGTLKLTYQTLGGEWTLESSQITAILADMLHNPRVTAWEEVTGYPAVFPPVDHEWNLADMVGMSQIGDKLDAIANAIVQNYINGFGAHQLATNPHGITPAMIGTMTTAEIVAAINAAAGGGGGGAGAGYQPLDDSLTAIANAVFSADRYFYFTSASTIAQGVITSAGRTLLSQADAAGQRSTMAAAGTGVSNNFTAGQNFSRSTVASHATAANIWSGGNSIDFTGTAVVTTFPTAPQAGASRRLHCAGACTFVNSDTLQLQGGGNFVATAGDIVDVEAITTTTFKATIHKKNGTQVAAGGGVGGYYTFGDRGGVVSVSDAAQGNVIVLATCKLSETRTLVAYLDALSGGSSYTQPYIYITLTNAAGTKIGNTITVDTEGTVWRSFFNIKRLSDTKAVMVYTPSSALASYPVACVISSASDTLTAGVPTILTETGVSASSVGYTDVAVVSSTKFVVSGLSGTSLTMVAASVSGMSVLTQYAASTTHSMIASLTGNTSIAMLDAATFAVAFVGADSARRYTFAVVATDTGTTFTFGTINRMRVMYADNNQGVRVAALAADSFAIAFTGVETDSGSGDFSNGAIGVCEVTGSGTSSVPVINSLIPVASASWDARSMQVVKVGTNTVMLLSVSKSRNAVLSVYDISTGMPRMMASKYIINAVGDYPVSLELSTTQAFVHYINNGTADGSRRVKLRGIDLGSVS